MIILEILLYIALFLLALIALILVLPIFYKAWGQKYDAVFLKAEVSGPLNWFYFNCSMEALDKMEMHLKLLGINVSVKGKKEPGKKHKEGNEKDKRKRTKKHEKGFFKKIIKVVKGFWQHIKPRFLEVEGRYGFEDPYYTGLACAAANCTVLRSEKYNISLTPVFDDEVIEGRFKIEGRIIPAVLIAVLIKVFIIPRLKAKLSFKKCAEFNK